MERISRQEFTDRFPVTVPAWNLDGIQSQPISIDRDAVVSGILEKDLVVRSGAKAIVHGIVKGSIVIEPNAVAHLYGIVEGKVEVRGAACIRGIIGSLVAADGAVVCMDAIESSHG